jgi:putative Ca2+/H+ antiporter (TMEM165/GDT1 family)
LGKKELDADTTALEAGEARRPQPKTLRYFSPVFVQGFTMTFLAEWGDRSQIATIGMAAAKNPYGVTLGGILGHAVCTGLAVVGGKMLATSISERTVAWMGGVLFVLFALHGFVERDV